MDEKNYNRRSRGGVMSNERFRVEERRSSAEWTPLDDDVQVIRIWLDKFQAIDVELFDRHSEGKITIRSLEQPLRVEPVASNMIAVYARRE
jgi:hypothetical protein